MTKVKNQSLNNIYFIGENVLNDNGNLTAYYVLPLVNFTTSSKSSIMSEIDSLTEMFKLLSSNRKGVQFTIERIEKVIEREDVIKNMHDNIKLYLPEYEMPKAFTDRIQKDVQEYCLLGIKLDTDEIEDLEAMTIKEVAKELVTSAATSILGLKGLDVDEKRVINLEANIFSIIRGRVLRATKELIFYNYVSKLFPNYVISYAKDSIIDTEHFDVILGSLVQTVEDKFGYFILQNDGVDFFGHEPKPTYGSVLNIRALPEAVDSTNFPLNTYGTKISVNTFDTAKVLKTVKQNRSEDRVEQDDARQAGMSDAVIETSAAIEGANMAIREIEMGELFCEYNISILITALDLPTLKLNVAEMISALNDSKIIASKSLAQAEDFFYNYVSTNPKTYRHFSSIRLPLSLQMNAGATVGDVGTGIFSPAIGESLK